MKVELDEAHRHLPPSIFRCCFWGWLRPCVSLSWLIVHKLNSIGLDSHQVSQEDECGGWGGDDLAGELDRPTLLNFFYSLNWRVQNQKLIQITIWWWDEQASLGGWGEVVMSLQESLINPHSICRWCFWNSHGISQHIFRSPLLISMCWSNQRSICGWCLWNRYSASCVTALASIFSVVLVLNQCVGQTRIEKIFCQLCHGRYIKGLLCSYFFCFR